MRDLISTFDDGVARFRNEKWRQVFEDQNATTPLTFQSANPLFGLPLGEGSVDFQSSLSKEDLWSRIRTLSQFAVLEGEELESVKKTFYDSLDSEGTLIDEAGQVTLHGKTVVFWTSKIPAEPL